MKNLLKSKAVYVLAAAGLGVVVNSMVSNAKASRSSDQVAFDAKGHPYVKGELLVKARSQAAVERMVTNRLDGANVTTQRKAISGNADSQWYKVKIPDEKAWSQAISSLQIEGEDEILTVEPNYIYSINLGPGKPEPVPSPTVNPGKGGPEYKTAPALPPQPVQDPELSKLYGLGKIGAAKVWEKTTGSRKVIVADIDTGIDYNHVDLMNNLWTNPNEIPGDGLDNDNNGYIDDVIGYDMRDKDARPFDDNQHGSHTSGTIAATGDNGVGVSGVAKVASLMVCRFLGGPDGSGTSEDAINCIDYATKTGAQIMSNSWGGGGFSQGLHDAIERANSAGILFIAAAGNSGADNDVTPSYPSGYSNSNIIADAALASNGSLASYSQYGASTVDIAAPGSGIFSTVPVRSKGQTIGSYASYNGTSMATPHVTGAAAMYAARRPGSTAAQIKAGILNSAVPTASVTGKVVTNGRLDVSGY